MKTYLFILSILLLISCNKESDDPPFEPTPIEFIEIINLQLNGNEGIPQSNQVITNSVDWQNLLNQINPNGGHPVSLFSEIDIDFSSYLIIAVFDEVRPHTGFEIIIETIIEEFDVIIVNYTIQTLNWYWNTTSQPFHIVKTTITDKPFEFVEVD